MGKGFSMGWVGVSDGCVGLMVWVGWSGWWVGVGV